MNSYFFSDPLVKNIIEKRLIQAFETKNDKLLFRYLAYIEDSLPVDGREIEDEDKDLFLELIDILIQYKDHRLVKKFMKSKIFQKHFITNINIAALKNIHQIKAVSLYQSEDVTPIQNRTFQAPTK